MGGPNRCYMAPHGFILPLSPNDHSSLTQGSLEVIRGHNQPMPARKPPSPHQWAPQGYLETEPHTPAIGYSSILKRSILKKEKSGMGPASESMHSAGFRLANFAHLGADKSKTAPWGQ